jgi:hypothetical protein
LPDFKPRKTPEKLIPEKFIKKDNNERNLFFPDPKPAPPKPGLRPRGEAPPSASGAPIATKTTTYTL